MSRPADPAGLRSRRLRRGGLLLVVLAVATLAFGQFRRGGGGRIPEETRTAREVPSRSTGTPMWEYPAAFQKDVFTFARLRYGTGNQRGGVGGGNWHTDFPDADLNLSYRLQQMTSIKVDPNARVLRANDPELLLYPFLHTAAAGAMDLAEDEIVGLRRYLTSGGFFLITDFWGDREWNHFEAVMKQVLPQHRFVELELSHPIYHSVYPIRAKNQVPRIDIGEAFLRSGAPTWERGPDGEQVHHRAIVDDKGRLMVLALHNSDDSDGWEREGEEINYFHKFAEGMAYPLAINIIYYVMTH